LSAALEVLADETLPLRSRRFATGHVRECHADLHARNIVRQRAQLLAFDCLEFDPALRWIDTADEISFLLADLETRQRPLHAHAFLSRYLEESGDYQACALLRLFKAHRALVRAKITALTATQSADSGAELGTARGQFAAYVECARRAVTPGRPVLLLMCGLSGSGKSWLARRLAPPLGAVHLRSDIERRRLAGLSATERSASGVEQGVYSRAATAAVYDCLAQYAADTLAGGCTTIVDATFARREDRTRFRDLAARLGANTCIVYCRAPRKLLQTRILERQRRQDDPSEADLAVLSWQETHFTEPQAGEASAVLEAQTPDHAAVELLIRRVAALSR
jgi:uncharacterized protein